MFTEPITITVNSIAKTLNRISVGQMKAQYQSSDELWTLDISHQYAGKGNSRLRTMVRLTQKKIVTNPLDSTNDYDTVSDTRVIDRPLAGWTSTEVQQLVAGFNAWEGNATVDKLYGKES